MLAVKKAQALIYARDAEAFAGASKSITDVESND
jgi:hypothetical protein